MKPTTQRFIHNFFMILAGMVFTAASLAEVYYVHSDHLGTPRVLTDQNQNVVWSTDAEPFGNAATSGKVTFNLRFPGQYYDQETGLHYNYHRYYDPSIGRYITSDPIGLAGGLNTYGYAYQNPIRFSDPSGLAVTPETAIDILSLSLSINEFNNDPNLLNALGVAVDGIGALTPLLPAVVGIVRQCDNIADVAKGGEKGGLNLFKWGKDITTKTDRWKEGDFMLYLPDKGSPKANWAQNASRLREQITKGNPIYDSYRNPTTGERIPTEGFLRAERNLLESRGWRYDSSTGAYHPPGN